MDSDGESDNSDRVPVPSFQNSFSQDIEAAFMKLDTPVTSDPLSGKRHRSGELGSGLCDDLGGGWGRERSRRERKYVYTWLIHSAIQQKLMQHCKASIFP